MISVMGISIGRPNVLLRLGDHFFEKAFHAAALGFIWDGITPILAKLFHGDLKLLVLMCLLVALETITLFFHCGWSLFSEKNRVLKQHINDTASMAVLLLVAVWLSNAFPLLGWVEVWMYMLFAILTAKAIAKNVGQLRAFDLLVAEISRRTGQNGQGNGSGPTSS